MNRVVWSKWFIVSMVTGVLLVFLCGASQADVAQGPGLRSAMFEKADQAMEASDSHYTRFFAPKTFEDGLEYYKEAESYYRDGESMKDINEKLDKAIERFNKAVVIRDAAREMFSGTEEARNDAQKVRASKYNTRQWEIAESNYKRAINKLEKGDTQKAKALAEEAKMQFRIVERDTVKISYLKHIWEKLKTIENMNSKEYYAPKSYQMAVELVKQAEAEFDQQAYGNEKAKQLIKQAEAQVDRALKISEFIKKYVDAGKTFEDLVIEAQIPFE